MKTFSIIIALSLFTSLLAQTNQAGKKIAYRKEDNLVGVIYTRGFGIGYAHAKIKGIYKTVSTEILISQMKHAKEQKIKNIFDSDRSFIYGKQNAFYQARLTRSWSNLLFYKSESKGVRVDYHLKAGPILGVVKPYYLNLREPGSDWFEPEITQIKYEDDRSTFLDPFMIHSGTRMTTGLSESALVPGMNFDLGLNFDFGTFTDLVRRLDLGINLDVYRSRVNMMVYEEPSRYFVTLYARMAIGWRSL